MPKFKDPKVFEDQVRAVWGDEVTLITPYKCSSEKVLVHYNSCGHEDWKKPSKLLDGQGCHLCRFKKMSKTKTFSTDQFQKQLIDSGLNIKVLSEYRGRREKVLVQNLACGHTYSAQAGNILNGSGCPVCHGFKDTDKFKEQVEEKYPGEYDVVGQYVNNRTPIEIIHKKCGHKWSVVPKDLLRAYRCPNCNMSLGEHLIEDFLKSHSVDYQCQYSFSDCRDKKPLPFDFAVFDKGQIKLIEFDGSHHYRYRSSGWNTSDHLPKVQLHDKIKTDYCSANNIPLLRIPYWKTRSLDNLLASFLHINL